MAFPKDLRQRMINLMYLVLMAMLAINIDPAALQGYYTINDGMDLSFNALDVKNKATYSTIEAKASEEAKEKNKLYVQKAEELKGLSDDLLNFISQTVEEVKTEATTTKHIGEKNEVEEFFGDSKDPGNNLMIGPDIKTGKAAELRSRILETIEKYKNVIATSPLPEEKQKELIGNLTLLEPSDEHVRENPENKDKKGWEAWTFQGKPAIAIMAILNQYKNDTKATEGQVLDAFAYDMNADKIDIPYDTFNLAFVPSSTYMAEGESFNAKLSVGQSSSKAKDLVRIFVNGQERPVDSEGFATYTATSGVGSHKVTAYALVTNPQTNEVTRVELEKPVEYRVAKPSATVSADKMNVFYIGLENPVSVSATGIADAKATCSGCASFSPNSTGGYNAKVSASSGKEVTVSVTSEGKNISSSKFRVLKVPDPEIKVGNYKSGSSIATASLQAQGVLRADLSNFPYDAPFKVVGYDLAMMRSGKGAFTAKSNSGAITSEMKNAFGKAGAGWIVIFRNIKVQGPGGDTRDVGSVTYITK